MKKHLSLLLVVLLVLSLLTGCTGTIVVIDECTCPTQGISATTTVPADSDTALKTGLFVLTDVSGSASATAEKDGKVAYDVTLAAVLVDEAGIIHACSIDSLPATVAISAAGAVTSDTTAAPLTKNELGSNYGMAAASPIKKEWNEQIAALCSYAVGKTVAQLKSGAIDESGKAPQGSDLASSATIYLGGYVSAIEAAVNNAQYLGAAAGDTLSLVTINSLSAGDASAEKAGTAQLDASIAVVSQQNGIISSCLIDAVQAKVSYDTTGTITTDLAATIPTKNQLGESYGMGAISSIKAEWNTQAASFAAYVTGKTAQEVAGIAVTESTKPADGTDLATSVTIAIGGFLALIAKAMA